MNVYLKIIAEELAKMNRADVDPRHILGYFLLTTNDTSGASRHEIATFARDHVFNIDLDKDLAERLAASYGL